MGLILENTIRYIFMLALVVLSAGFAGTETALFKLTKHQKSTLQKSGHRLDVLILQMLTVPGNLLTVLLFGNLLVNVLYFAIAGSISVSLSRNNQHIASAVQGGLSLILLIIFGEMLPKSYAYSHSILFARLTALPTYLLFKFAAPVLNLFNLLIILPFTRLVSPIIPRRHKITTDHLKMLINEAAKSDIDPKVGTILNEIIGLRDLKVRDIMQQRLEIVSAEIQTPVNEAIELMVTKRIKKLPIYNEDSDNIVGIVTMRTLLTENKGSLAECIVPVAFVPEQKKADSLLEMFRDNHRDIAIVVDEYGGVSGLITIKDIIYEIMGASKADIYGIVEQIGPLSYRLGGDLPLHDWLDVIGVNEGEGKYTTLGGFVTALMGKIPSCGESVKYENITFTIESMDKHRVKTLIVELAV